jgi:hypothetical protein
MLANLFTTKHRWIKNGVLKKASLAQIWKEYPPEMHEQLFKLMQKFEIAYTLNDRQILNLPNALNASNEDLDLVSWGAATPLGYHLIPALLPKALFLEILYLMALPFDEILSISIF